MQKMVEYTPVTLDVNSAHADLLISGGLLQVSDTRVSQPVPDNAERFDSSVSVLSSVDFCLGIHSWEVEVEPKNAWTLGVAKEGVARKGNVMVSPEVGSWAMGMWNGEQYSAGTSLPGYPVGSEEEAQEDHGQAGL
ncbi:zinc finger protein RFP-like [Oncorhynchus tshawytscha]|uniref:zinc finger protein RFP-like n=1 Tax=Oncorhynchus tshawytscha TaxID=74940 RepID=UPI001C3E54DD|nr:zinc finger protein RFP-like [Oncorhynchus tshawytscha]